MPDAAELYAHPLVTALLGESWHPGGRAVTAELVAMAGLEPGARVLDVACGRGASALLLAERGCEVVGLDAGKVHVGAAARRARERSLGAAFCAGRALPLPFRDMAFDGILSECALCLFGDRDAALREMRRVLRPGGALALADVTLERPVQGVDGAFGFAACVAGAVPRGTLAQTVRDAGFRDVRATDRGDALRQSWARLGRSVDLPKLAVILGPALAPLGIADAPGALRSVEDALRDGNLGYSLVAARA